MKFSGFKRQNMSLPAPAPPAKMGAYARKGVIMNRRSRLKDWLYNKTRDMDLFTIILGPIIAVALVALAVVVVWALYEGAVALLNKDKGWILLLIVLLVVFLVGTMMLLWWSSKAPSKATQVLKAFAKEEARKKQEEADARFYTNYPPKYPSGTSSISSNP